MIALALLRRFWPYLLVGVLIGASVWMFQDWQKGRAEIRTLKASLSAERRMRESEREVTAAYIAKAQERRSQAAEIENNINRGEYASDRDFYRAHIDGLRQHRTR